MRQCDLDKKEQICEVCHRMWQLGWVAANDVLALNKDPLTATIVIDDDDTFGQVSTQLKESGIIESKFLFNLFATFTHA